ncbi:hypothetical protein L345_08716, partial [Ophiophagus hannah]
MTCVPSSRLPWQRQGLRPASYFLLSVKVPCGALLRAGTSCLPEADGKRLLQCMNFTRTMDTKFQEAEGFGEEASG